MTLSFFSQWLFLKSPQSQTGPKWYCNHILLKYLTSTVSLTKEEIKYFNPTPTNTETFCDKTSYLTDCVGGNYQVRDNISIVGNGTTVIFLPDT
ncbi:hypothetical protein DVH24_005075 [Malus domestica]|uniref:Uncharacterized protein n=1 Tax=Malus domestica TaxID=3750 RepID=A0A498II42_MALDO|nr:hypothetical protein DVH24_005075 [Malus domestica]